MNKKDRNLLILIIVLGLLLVLDPFFHRGIFAAHDIHQNIARFGAFFLSFKEGHLVPRWAQYIARNHGGPVLMLSYSLAYYLALPIKLLGFNLISAIKLQIALSFIASAVFMYKFLKKHFSSEASFLGALIYLYTPYRITDIFARGSVSENTAFLVVPLVLIGLFNLWKKPIYKNSLFLSLSLWLLLISHPFFLVIMLPIFAGYQILLWLKKFEFKQVKYLFLSGIIFLGLSSYFIMPLLAEKKYTHYDICPFIGPYKTEHVTLKKLIFPQWTFTDRLGKKEYQTWQLGLVNLAIVLLSLWTIYKSKNKNKKLIIVPLLVLTLSIFLMMKVSLPVYEIITPLQQVQFPWRFLALSTVSLSFLAASCLEFWLKKLTKHKTSFMCALILALIISIAPFSRGHNYQYNNDDYYFYETNDNTEGQATAPRWSAQPELYNWPEKPVEIISGKAEINNLELKSTYHCFKLNVQDQTRIVDNTFYYPNWQVFVDGQPVGIQFQDPNYRGLITFEVEPGQHLVEVKFLNTRLRQLADLLSVSTLTLSLIPILLKPVRHWGKKSFLKA